MGRQDPNMIGRGRFDPGVSGRTLFLYHRFLWSQPQYGILTTLAQGSVTARDRLILVQVQVAESGPGHMSGHETGEGCGCEPFPQTLNKSGSHA